MSFDGFPLIMGWEFTLACNLRCEHCGSSAGTPRQTELSTQEALNICDQFPDLLVQEVDFTGGEPLIRDDFHIIAKRLHDYGIRTQVLSNGLILDDIMVDRLKRSHIAGVGISLDGPEKLHDYIRSRPGVFQSVVSGIKRLMKAEIPVAVITTVNGFNIYELPNLMNIILSLGVKTWQVQPVFTFGRVKESPQLKLTSDEYLKLGEFVKNFSPKAHEFGLDIVPADSFGYYTDFDERSPKWMGCPAGLLTCGITSDGRIKGCLSMPDELAKGDLKKRSLWDIWFDPETFEYNRGFFTSALGPNCNHCGRGEECKGGCSSMSYGNTGSFHNDPYCFYALRR